MLLASLVTPTGSLSSLRRLLDGHDGLASARVDDDKGASRTALHVAADWPGYFPNGPAVVRLLIEAGADPDAPIAGSWHSETPLHWAASSDDVDVADALIDGGADMEAQGASIGGGTPLDDAVAHGCWHVARRLAERGARVDRRWHAAALGMLAVSRSSWPRTPRPHRTRSMTPSGSHAMAASAGWLDTCSPGADLNWTPDHSTATPLDIAGSPDTRREALVSWLCERGARSAGKPA
jgi:hypothetical protein